MRLMGMSALFPGFAVVCALLVVAGGAKLRSPSAASAALSGARVRVSRPAVRALGVAEMALGVSATVHPTPLLAGLVALAYGSFCSFVVSGRAARCGCFGAASDGGGPAHAVLNAAACAVAVLAAVAPPSGIVSIAGRTPVIAVPLGLGIAAAALAAYLSYTALPRAWRAYGGDAR
jgi:hypothetical protein